jgi:hypothetical protein
MNLADKQQIDGLPKYLYHGQHDRTDELNSRILERNVSDQPLEPNFSPRPVITRYSHYPMIDSRKPSTVPITPKYDYSLENNFTPPVMKKGPPSGFINNIQKESHLRNQIHALSKGDDINAYIPSSDSDLYKVRITSFKTEQPYPGLFNKPTFSQEQHPNVIGSSSIIGKDLFNNSTRVQLRNIDA